MKGAEQDNTATKPGDAENIKPGVINRKSKSDKKDDPGEDKQKHRL